MGDQNLSSHATALIRDAVNTCTSLTVVCAKVRVHVTHTSRWVSTTTVDTRVQFANGLHPPSATPAPLARPPASGGRTGSGAACSTTPAAAQACGVAALQAAGYCCGGGGVAGVLEAVVAEPASATQGA